MSDQKQSNNSYTTDGKVQHFSKNQEVNAKLAEIIGEKFIAYRKRWDAANRFELETDFPLFLHLDMNQECNLECPHCIIGHPNLTDEYYSGTRLTWVDYKKVIDEGHDHQCPSLSVQGNNEPLLNKKLESYIEYAAKRGFIDIMMNTNASALTERRARKLLDSGLTRLRFSIDAVNPVTYAKTRVGGDYNKVIRNIERFLDLKEAGGYKLPITGVSFCKMAGNENEVAEFFTRWQDKVDIVTIQTFVPPTLDDDFRQYYASDQIGTGDTLEKFNCVQPFQRVVIRNYEITPCCSNFGTRLKIGDLRHDTVYDAWNSQKMKDLRDIHRKGEYHKDPICKQCVSLIYPKSQNSRIPVALGS
jgi:radical SAM protein with 4Fe4S-binding SPASM domain